jgi:hypothetical protein
MSAAEKKPRVRVFEVEDIFTIVHDALWPFFDGKKVTVEQEKLDDEGEMIDTQTMEVPTMEFIMRAIGAEMADRWTTDKEKEVLQPMHAVLDPRDYEEFTFSIDDPVVLITYKHRGGAGAKKSRKTRRRRV